MRPTVVFLICLNLLFSCAKNTFETNLACINIIDRNGFSETINTKERLLQFEKVDFLKAQPYQKVMRVYKRDDKGDIYAYITSYYPNGQPKQYLEVVNSRAYGKYYEWHSNGNLKVEGTIIGGIADLSIAAEKSWLFDGCNKVWNEESCLIASFNYEKGVLQGPSYYYHPNGQIEKAVFYKNNLLEGEIKTYNNKGKLIKQASYSNGKLNGTSRLFFDDGKVALTELYNEDLLVSGTYKDKKGNTISTVSNGTGFQAIFSTDGTLEKLQEIKKGVVEGLVKVFTKDRFLARTYYVKDGIKNGIETIYYPLSSVFDDKSKPQPKVSITWREGKIQGLVKSWYENGVLESQREVSNNQKHGLLTAWYIDGSLMMVEEYDRDTLIKGEYYQKGNSRPVSQVKQGNGTATLYDSEGNFIRKVSYHQGKPSY